MIRQKPLVQRGIRARGDPVSVAAVLGAMYENQPFGGGSGPAGLELHNPNPGLESQWLCGFGTAQPQPQMEEKGRLGMHGDVGLVRAVATHAANLEAPFMQWRAGLESGNQGPPYPLPPKLRKPIGLLFSRLSREHAKQLLRQAYLIGTYGYTMSLARCT